MNKLLLFIVVFCSLPFAVFSSYRSNIHFDDQIDYQRLQNNIIESEATTVEQALKLIPEEFYKGYVLVYRSRSLQESSFSHPRAIVYGRSARFIMSFNGDPKHRGYNNLEIIQFDQENQRWDFHEITFRKGQSPQFSKNPKKCMECHQSPKRQNVDMRPNWEPYNFWPGVYASVDNEIKPRLIYQYEKKQRGENPYGVFNRFLEEDMVLISEQAQEEEQLQNFTSNIKPDHPRYSLLGEFSTRAPLSLTKSLVSLNMYRVARLIKEELGPLYDDYKYSLYGLGTPSSYNSKDMVFKCGEMNMPLSLLDKHFSLATELKAIDKWKVYDPRIYREEKWYGYWKVDLEASFDVLFKPLGIMTDDWSMDFKTKGRFSFRNRFTSPSNSTAQFRDALVAVNPDDKASFMNCEDLKRQSERHLNRLYLSGEWQEHMKSVSIPEANKDPQALLNRCISCHVEYESPLAPYIAFHDPQKLKLALKDEKYKRGTLLDEIKYRMGSHVVKSKQMPPAGAIDRELRENFIQWLEGL